MKARAASLLLALACGSASEGAAPPDAAASNGRPCAASGTSGCIYTTLPSSATCDAGVLAPEWQARALAQVNRIRLIAGVPEIPLAQEASSALQACTLVNALLEATNSDPPKTAACWSEAARNACRESNLTTLGFRVPSSVPDTVFRSLQGPEVFVDSWLLDDAPGPTPEAPSLGHRRWLLDPFLGPTAFAMSFSLSEDAEGPLVRQVGALRVITTPPTEAIVLERDVVAWPIDEVPAALVAPDGWLLASIVVSVTEPGDNAVVDFSRASVRISAAGADVPIALGADGLPDLRYTGAGKGPVHGLANHLQWRTAAPLSASTDYSVVIDGIAGQGAPESVSYTFRITP